MNWKEVMKPSIVQVVLAVIAAIADFIVMAGCFAGPMLVCKLYLNDFMYWTSIIWFPLIIYVITGVILTHIKK